MIDAKRYGPWAVIVGGSEGIGESFAQMLGAAGINSLLVARKPEALAAAAEAVRSHCGAEVRTLSLDVGDEDAAQRIIAATEGLEVGMLIHNVGGGYSAGPFLEHARDDVLRTIRSNVFVQSELALHYAPGMVARGAGGIIFVGSMAGNVGSYHFATYSGVKAFTQMFGEALWAELGPQGVDVVVLVLGATDTPSRRRSGVVDAPEMPVAKCDDVARLALEGLGREPVIVPPENAQFFNAAGTMPRKAAAEMLRDLMTRMAG
jgi:uncharacterized protein